MNVYAINGSPRKTKNTAILLNKALEGAKERTQAEIEIIHLYDLNYQSCISCFECKRIGGKSYGKCVIKDPLAPVLEKISTADAIIFGSPIYFGGITGKMKSFLERLLFPYGVYDLDYTSIAPKKMPTAFIYTMNVQEEMMKEIHYPELLSSHEFSIEKLLTKPSILYSCDTYQFDDYSKYKNDRFHAEDKLKHK